MYQANAQMSLLNEHVHDPLGVSSKLFTTVRPAISVSVPLPLASHATCPDNGNIVRGSSPSITRWWFSTSTSNDRGRSCHSFSFTNSFLTGNISGCDMGVLSPSVYVEGREGWVLGAKGNCTVGGSVWGLSTGYQRKWFKGKFRMLHLSLDPFVELLPAPRCVDLFAKHQIKIKSALYWTPTLVRLSGQIHWSKCFVASGRWQDFSKNTTYELSLWGCPWPEILLLGPYHTKVPGIIRGLEGMALQHCMILHYQKQTVSHPSQWACQGWRVDGQWARTRHFWSTLVDSTLL